MPVSLAKYSFNVRRDVCWTGKETESFSFFVVDVTVNVTEPSVLLFPKSHIFPENQDGRKGGREPAVGGRVAKICL